MMSIRNSIAAIVLGAAMVAPTVQFALAESSLGENPDSDVYSEMYAQQPRETLGDLLQGHAQPQPQEARNATATPSATDATASGSSQPANPHMYDYFSGPAFQLRGGN